MTSPLPQVQVLLALANNAFDDPGLIAATTAPGAASAVKNTWTDITPWVLSIGTTRGRQHELAQFQAGTITVTVDNTAGIFSRWNTASPIHGLLAVRRPIKYRVRSQAGTWYDRFTGVLNAIQANWPDPLSQSVTFTGADMFRLFNTIDLATNQYFGIVQADGAAQYFRLSDSTAVAVDALGGPSGAYEPTLLPTFGVPGPFATDAYTAVGFASTGGSLSMPATVGRSSGTVEWWMVGGDMEIFFPTSTYLTCTITGTGQIQLGTQNGMSMVAGSAGPVMPQDGLWHHLAFTWSIVGSYATLSCYVDGVLGLSTPEVMSFAAACTETFVSATTVGGETSEVACSVADVAIYNTVLTTAKMASHITAGLKCRRATTTGGRISDCLDTISWPVGARNIDAGYESVQENMQSLAQTTALAHMQACELTEAGALFMTASGVIRFLSRTTLLTAAPYLLTQATFGDTGPPEIPYQAAPQLSSDDQLLYNIVICGRDGGVTQVATSPASVAQYGPQTLTMSGLLSPDDVTVLGRAQYAITQYAQPKDRMASVTVQMTDIANAAGQNDTVLALDLMERVTVTRHAVGFVEVGLIEGVSETVGVDSWAITFALSPADSQTYWIVGDPVFGLAGQTTVASF